MDEVKGGVQDDQLIICLSGRIDSSNAPSVEAAITDLAEGHAGEDVTVDAHELEYISSAGLRVLLRLRRSLSELKITGVNSDIYEILEMTGFTQMMKVEKAYQKVSIEGCEVIGRGANGTVYRIDGDNVVKVYSNADALEDIQRERELARLALVLGIPTAISYDVVRVGDSYGSVFELLDARSFSKILESHPEKMDWCLKEYIDLLKTIHEKAAPEGKLTDMRQTAIEWVKSVQDYLPQETGVKLLQLIEAIPRSNHMLHGDYHTKNLQLTGDEVLLIDMDTLAVGHPIFELAAMFNAFVGFGEYDENNVEQFLGFDADRAREFWRRSLAAYLETRDEDRIREVENKARIIGYTRMIRRSIRRGGLESEEKLAEIELWKKELIELVEKTNTLDYLGKEIVLEASRENLPEVLTFVSDCLESADCSPKEQMQLDLAVEEIFINIASYAYKPGKGSATVRVEVSEDPVVVSITFIDKGVPYDPLAKEDPDTTLPASERKIGGLGIFMVKQSVDDILYDYKDGQNILTLKKEIHK